MKIRARLTLNFLIAVSAIILLIFAAIYSAAYFYTKQNFNQRLYNKALTTAILLLKVEEVDSSLLKTIDKAQRDVLLNEKVVVYNDSGMEIYTNNDLIELELTPEDLQTIKRKKNHRFTYNDYTVTGIYYTDRYNRAVAVAAAMDKAGDELLEMLRVMLLFSYLLSLGVVAVTGWFFVGRALSPITNIVNKVATLSPVERSERLPVANEDDEINTLVKTFNGLFDKLEDSFKLQKNFVANVSHEINNPLTKIKSQIEVSMMQNRDEAQYRRVLQSILEDANDLTILLQNLLQFSKITSNQEMPLAPFRIDELLFDVRQSVMRNNALYKVNIEFTKLPVDESELVINGNKTLFGIALKNITENACKFSEDNTALIELSGANGVTVTITDKGPGIAAADLPHIFEPFYRSPSMVSVKGYGIGLALAHRILQAHGIRLQVKSEKGKGSSFFFTISNKVLING
ncbi:MAG: HAMP domain-containing histidine kinase [Chitinophagales bacterium]|nr:HAMP domain-containing histidine kinase [Chitinophagales bacterium]MDW8419897.1 HAMP domain-containing sensor histidine kinase [Chitinophagales bacterium]